ncbi:AhpD family alkylhydroperoxidase [Nocardia tenerifensis]|uniref:AhpD family alkylhydroperoxidase n=2 Tax=Nocardia tenerifensis TaxID=228006 RepID=A0A318K6M2_9NOCA|nr:GNAT family N-acetyltransferase [Nocardia tenerifensis]PXX68344.1 AhpD family alkylhydroperoxidase [Nocardia tenerifensis]
MKPDVPHDRVWIDKQTPTAFRALVKVASEVRAAAAAVGLDRKLIELVNLRVSQISGCAFCLDTHQRAALAAGNTEQELAVLSAWRRTELYSPMEQAALALAEVTATLPDEHTMDREYAFARKHLTDDQLSVVVWAATTIGAFNRVSILSRHPVRASKEKSTMTAAAESTVVRNDEKHRYEVFYGGELAGFAEYEERDDETVFTHTEIDGAFSGKGLGSTLAKHAIEDTVERGRVIRPLCPFIKAYLDKHPQYDAQVIGKGISR